MDPIQQIVKRAAGRLRADRALRIGGWGLLALVSVLCLLVLADKLFFIGKPIAWAALGAACAACGAVAFLSLRRRPSRRGAAIEMDRRLRLAERISSALAVGDSDHPMARALVEDGKAYARAVPVAKTFPVRFRRPFWAASALAFAIPAMLAYMPQFDLLKRQEQLRVAQKEREQVKREAQRMRKEMAQLRKRAGATPDERVKAHIDEIEKLIQKMEKGELTRAEAMAKLSEMADDIRKDQQALAEKALQQKPSALKEGYDASRSLEEALAQKQFEQTKSLAESLAAQDFKSAAAEMKKLADKAKSGELSREEMEKLSEELAKLAKTMDLKDLSELLGECSACLKDGDLSELAAKLAQCEFKMDELADMMEQLDVLSACAGMCKGGGCGLGNRLATWNGAGIYSQGNQRGLGRGMGGPGIGAGGVAPVTPEDVKFQTHKLKGEIQKGRVVGSFFTDGKALRGEAKVAYQEAVEAAEADMARAMEQEEIPRPYEEYVREYFHSMKGK